jgi:hypothetical protein
MVELWLGKERRGKKKGKKEKERKRKKGKENINELFVFINCDLQIILTILFLGNEDRLC